MCVTSVLQLQVVVALAITAADTAVINGLVWGKKNIAIVDCRKHCKVHCYLFEEINKRKKVKYIVLC